MTNAVSLAQQASTGVSQGFKNRIINGAMVIDQRNAGAQITPVSGQYLTDRWNVYVSQASKLTAQQNAGSVTPPAGFVNYQGITSTSAYTVTTGDYFSFQQRIEGYNMADLNWGSANAKTVTLSFWVRSSLTGTFGGSLMNDAATRSYPYSYTISAANTWEQKTITIIGCPDGAWATTTQTGIGVFFGLGVSSTYSGTAGAWANGNYTSATGAISVVGTNGATWYVTGVQLEVGSSATSFEYRSIGTELMLCQRYFQFLPVSSGAAASSTQARGLGAHFGEMRAAPTVAATGVLSITDSYTADFIQSSAAANVINNDTRSSFFDMPNFSGLTGGRIYFFPRYQNSNKVSLSAEL